MEPFASASRNGVYGAAVAAVDWSTGVVMAELRRLGLEENTIVIFTSDNGSRVDEHGGSNAPLRGTKGQTWEGGMRVPCLVRWPGHITPGSVCGEMVTALDFYPTLAALAGHDLASLPVHDGQNVLPLWEAREGAQSPHEHFFYFKRADLQAVRSGKWKLRHAFDSGPVSNPDRLELYDLGVDLAETRDLAKEHPDVVEKLSGAMNAMREKLGDRRLNIKGRERRRPAIVTDPKPLTTFDPNYPYIEPSYLLDQAG
jgi:arylsulfatase A-like enzyme